MGTCPCVREAALALGATDSGFSAARSRWGFGPFCIARRTLSFLRRSARSHPGPETGAASAGCGKV